MFHGACASEFEIGSVHRQPRNSFGIDLLEIIRCNNCNRYSGTDGTVANTRDQSAITTAIERIARNETTHLGGTSPAGLHDTAALDTQPRCMWVDTE